ncbi:aminotransferase class I/II-fold pyridoxal phosphate-dependent enzyme [Dactylosporangium sp. CA-092794]|uniref:aminotransferase class I/II-fold pyridoxal phosphate-dependent enzyme n=1 Tax=Dactylosporangium sp. CA-092794 TaxID=3239929 RepID=UPI003D8A0911
MDLFDKFTAGAHDDPIVRLSRDIHGIAAFPKLTGAIGREMRYGGRPHVVWSLNNYLGLANHPEVRAADAEFARRYGLGAPMGSRMMAGETDDLEHLEAELADYARKPAAIFFNFGYQGMFSLIDALVTRSDWIVYDAASHACIIDGVRLHKGRGRTRAFPHNDVERLEAQLAQVQRRRRADEGLLVIAHGVYGMSGAQGRLRDIAGLKDRYQFRLLVDDAHGFGVLGPRGGGTGEAQDIQHGIDLYFATFSKAGAGVGAFVATDERVAWRLRYTMRSQIFAKGLPWPVVAGNRVRLNLIRTRPQLRAKAWAVASALQDALREAGLDIGAPASLVTPVFLPMEPEAAVRYIARIRADHGVFCSVVSYPVVPRGTVQLRLISTAEHELADVPRTVHAITTAYRDLRAA